MGGYGSGRRGGKSKVSELLRLDVRHWQRGEPCGLVLLGIGNGAGAAKSMLLSNIAWRKTRCD